MTTAYSESLGERIRIVRLRKGVTQKDLAEQTGIATSSLSEIETGVSEPAVSKVQAIAVALGVHVDQLLPPKRILKKLA